MSWKRTLLLVIVIVAAWGCNSAPTASIPTATNPVIPTPTLIFSLPTQSPSSTPVSTSEVLPTVIADTPAATTAPTTVTPTEASTSDTFVPFLATTTADAVKLRSGPGYLFPALNLLQQGAELTVLGRSPGDEWVYVRAENGTPGWVFAQLTKAEKDITTAPSVEPGDAFLVKGKVTEASGLAVNGIQFAITQGTENNAPRTDAITDAQGIFYAFFPTTASGAWTVAYTAISCDSIEMDTNCNCPSGGCGSPHPASTSVSLPTDQVLEFTWW